MSIIIPNSTGEMDELYPIAEYDGNTKGLAHRLGEFPKETFPEVHKVLYDPRITPEMREKIRLYLILVLWHPLHSQMAFQVDMGQLTWPWPIFGEDAVKIAAIVQSILNPADSIDKAVISELCQKLKMFYSEGYDEAEKQEKLNLPPNTLFVTARQFTTETPTEIQWLVEDLIPQGWAVVISGLPHAGKSLITLDLARAILTGEKFLGNEVKKGKVMLLCLDDDRTLIAQRMREFGFDQSEDLHIYAGRWDEILVMNQLSAALNEIKPSLIVVDTLIKTIPKMAGAENDSATMDESIEKFLRLTTTLPEPATVVFITHSKKSGESGARGSSATPGAAPLAIHAEKITEGVLNLQWDWKLQPIENLVVEYCGDRFQLKGENTNKVKAAMKTEKLEKSVNDWLNQATEDEQRTIEGIRKGTSHNPNDIRNFLKKSDRHYSTDIKTPKGQKKQLWHQKDNV